MIPAAVRPEATGCDGLPRTASSGGSEVAAIDGAPTLRSLSHSELRALTTCEARWDFLYGGYLAGTALRPKTATSRMRDGRAWGKAVAAWHAAAGRIDALHLARQAMHEALEEDADEQREAGVYDPAEHEQMAARLEAILAHYAATAEPMPITDREMEFEVALPSRRGGRRSNRYRLRGFLDGVHVDIDGRAWIVEFKLRGELSALEQLALDRQGRRYAWGWWQRTGREPAGVIYDERLAEAPRPPRINQNGRPSTDKRQLCTAEDYLAACREAGFNPDPEALEAFRSRRWQQRQRIIFRPGELAETGRELVALAQRVHELEAGRMPVREPHPAHCRGCAFSGICPDPNDAGLVDALYVRVPAKRDRAEVIA